MESYMIVGAVASAAKATNLVVEYRQRQKEIVEGNFREFSRLCSSLLSGDDKKGVELLITAIELIPKINSRNLDSKLNLLQKKLEDLKGLQSLDEGDEVVRQTSPAPEDPTAHGPQFELAKAKELTASDHARPQSAPAYSRASWPLSAGGPATAARPPRNSRKASDEFHQIYEGLQKKNDKEAIELLIKAAELIPSINPPALATSVSLMKATLLRITRENETSRPNATLQNQRLLVPTAATAINTALAEGSKQGALAVAVDARAADATAAPLAAVAEEAACSLEKKQINELKKKLAESRREQLEVQRRIKTALEVGITGTSIAATLALIYRNSKPPKPVHTSWQDTIFAK
jgi:hypothetical protein